MDAVKILGSLLSNNAMGSPRGGNILDNLLGGASGSGGGGAVDILTSLLGGEKRSRRGGGLGALGAILAAAAGAKGGKGGGSGLDMIGSILSGAVGNGKLGGLGELLGGGSTPQKKQSSGGLGDLLGSLLGGSAGGGLSSILGAAPSGAGGGDLLGRLVGQGEQAAPPQEANEEAEVLIEAMCNAAKSDGKIDETERSTILGKLGDLDESEVSYLRKQLSSPLDLEGFVSRVPDDMAEQVYVFSLMAIKLDSQKEARYFGQLAEGLGLDGDAANEIHNRLGQPEIFA